jgi:hypothetical protein
MLSGQHGVQKGQSRRTSCDFIAPIKQL